MTQKLSAMTYIKNNKRKISVLMVSLTMCFVLFYLAQFLLSTATETFQVFLIENAKKVQYVYLPAYAFDVDYSSLSSAEAWERSQEEHKKLGKKLEALEKVDQVYLTNVIYVTIYAVVGQYGLEVPLLPQEEIETYMQHYEAKLVEGRMPKAPNELLLDERIMKNGDYQIGDSIEHYSDTKIVGVVNSEYYFACGVQSSEVHANPFLCILSNGEIEDMTAYIQNLGYEFQESDANIIDIKEGERSLERDVIDAIETSTNLIYIAIILVLSILILIVYISYLRDRRNEWCFYSSIGFSRKTIYASVMRELLFTFGSSVALAFIIIGVSVVVLDHTMLQSMGLQCRYIYPNVILENLCAFAAILGILQIPVRYALYKIRTIDAMDDDLN